MTNVTHIPGTSTLSNADVKALREQYRALRNEAEQSIDTWADVSTTDQQLAVQYGVSRQAVTKLVTGQSRPHAGGPIDTDRRDEMLTYSADVKEYGTPEANRRRRFRQRRPQVDAAVTVRIDMPNGTSAVLTTPPGTVVSTTSTGDTSVVRSFTANAVAHRLVADHPYTGADHTAEA